MNGCGDELSEWPEAQGAAANGSAPSGPDSREHIQRQVRSEEGLSGRVERARKRIVYQYDPALYEELSEEEIAQERGLREWMRSQQRRQRKKVFRWDLAEDLRARKARAGSLRRDEREKRWHTDALAARRRATSPDAVVGRLYRRMMVMSRNLRVALVIPFVWSGVNVGLNLMPLAGHSGPGAVVRWVLWIVSFAFEAMISVPIWEIMRLSTTAAEFGRQVDRAKIVLIEAALLLVTIGLNAGPHLAVADWGRAAECAVAPIMVVVGMWIHAWLASRYATLIDEQLSAAKGSDSGGVDVVAAVDFRDAPGMMVRAWPPNSPSDPAAASAAFAESVSGPPVATPASTLSGLASSACAASPLDGSPGAAASGESGPVPVVGFSENSSEQDYCEAIAHTMVLRRMWKLSESDLVSILRLAESGENSNAIATRLSETGGRVVPRSTVDRAITRAAAFGLRVGDAHREVIARSA